jgi:hypothetical protein
MAYSCRYAPLVIALDLCDRADGDFPATPACREPAVFSTGVNRMRNGGRWPFRARTCAEHNAQFRTDPGYADSIRLHLTT